MMRERRYSSDHDSHSTASPVRSPVSPLYMEGSPEPESDDDSEDKYLVARKPMHSPTDVSGWKTAIRWSVATVIFVVVAAVGSYILEFAAFTPPAFLRRPTQVSTVKVFDDGNTSLKSTQLVLPEILMEKGVYHTEDFSNEIGVVPAHWDHHGGFRRREIWGPCYGYEVSKNRPEITWVAAIQKYNRSEHPNQQPHYNEAIIRPGENPDDLQGYCRPGFIIIGAGKCGTSSLYHYITAHPRVLPATEKQIHYYRYHERSPLKWYFQHFPDTLSFLASGALMSGEASPGYLPYPEVPIKMKAKVPEPRILAVGRNPLERAYSSYKYNYVTPTMERMQKGKVKGIDKHLSPQEHGKYLFSFEDMVRAELQQLRRCFAPGAEAEEATRRKWRKAAKFYTAEYARRERQGLPPMIDLDGFCYGTKVSDKVLRVQWTKLVAEQPHKIILDRNLHLTQALLGRSLYVFPLEWWYAAFPQSQLHFVCTEELQDTTGKSMNDVGQFLGLSSYNNFSAVVSAGAYNVGGHRGYDNEISWEELQKERGPSQAASSDVPLSDELRRELLDFIRPFNERLYKVIGKRCKWP